MTSCLSNFVQSCYRNGSDKCGVIPRTEENPHIVVLLKLIELQGQETNQLLTRQYNNNNHEKQTSNQDRTNNH